jgi:hypothetical protein
MDEPVTLSRVLKLAKKLPLKDKIRLIEEIAPQIHRELDLINKNARRSLRGIWRGLDITDEDITNARREMWSDFPRQDI